MKPESQHLIPYWNGRPVRDLPMAEVEAAFTWLAQRVEELRSDLLAARLSALKQRVIL